MLNYYINIIYILSFIYADFNLNNAQKELYLLLY